MLLKSIVLYIYGDSVMSETTVRRCELGRGSQMSMIRRERAIVIDEYIKKVEQIVRNEACFTILELSCEFPQISRTILYGIVTDRLGFLEFCTRTS